MSRDQWRGFFRTVFRRTALAGFLVVAPAVAQQTDIHGPFGSVAFGSAVAVLPNGNIVVTDPDGPASAIGAVYMYSPAGALISTLTGSAANDHVGAGGIVVLGNGNFLIVSPVWNNGLATQVGAVTWGDGNIGISGVVSSANSMIGSTPGDLVGSDGVTVLSNGNYVIRSANWNNGLAFGAGAATWGSGSTGTVGVVSAGNSLIGTTAGDAVGWFVKALSNGNYVMRSPDWDNGDAANAGAVTWGNGSTGVTGVVSGANSLVGTIAGDLVGADVVALSNGNYVVSSPYWHNGDAADAGAATWGSGGTGVSGPVSVDNSVIGTTAEDQVGGIVMSLGNGNYVIRSPSWDNGDAAEAGAVTWGNGSTGTVGEVSASNSLVGVIAGDAVGSNVLTVLSSGNYVVCSQYWHNGGEADAGAATWANGSTGTVGAVSIANSLIGSMAGDQVGLHGATALSNGNFVIRSPNWNNGSAIHVGAVTWVNGG
jgi:hypothetical protein